MTIASDRSERVVLITGVTSGIGRVTARELGGLGLRVIGVGRDPQKSKKVEAELRRETGNDAVTVLVADLGSQADVRRLAAEVCARAARLDVLINNAGGYFARRRLSPDGIELSLAVNLLAPFQLTHLPLDPLRAGPEGRVINVSSDAHMRGAGGSGGPGVAQELPDVGYGRLWEVQTRPDPVHIRAGSQARRQPGDR